MLTLYSMQSSGNSYKVRLLLALLKVPHEKIVIDNKRKEHKQAPFLALNPRGEVPVLEDEGIFIWDSAACLVYVARKHGGERWLPTDPAGMAEVMQWLALSNNELHYGLQWARGVNNKIKTGNIEEYQGYGNNGLKVLEGRLKGNDWLALGRPTRWCARLPS